MTTVDGLWYLADEASQHAERAYHTLTEAHGEGTLQRTYERHVSRGRFRTLARRIQRTGTPYGAHTLVTRADGRVLLVRHEGVDLWVLPGGGVGPSETFSEAAERELHEEAGITADYDGLAMLNRVEVRCQGRQTWGVLPVFGAKASTVDLSVADPDGEISAARWFAPEQFPEDTRDRDDLVAAARAVS
ncbi:NUDIX family hydrolase [Natronomonas pharaonis DSM 2160]|uniref:NUDIX family hydrolase n=1 Tax=Natronomonas pharaonis (strain ATCC 35678 / DSM 2160 / CIP 103997 / JCM 8858 / NBRC 14720 / NCIMB 2260 / Gabara) TaxID=348780 RepID=A0A1U7EXF3_NATPD|nr:NUDIX domain-containing protein [Natronomonas pharaonis]CAI49853.1 NUDIX family hydrolase [Natronomonas pharaonis DSM 2160]